MMKFHFNTAPKRIFDAISARTAALGAEAFMQQFRFKAEMDADAMKFMSPQTND